MSYTCPLCKRAAKQLIEIDNPYYAQCCQNCKEVAMLITQKYPHNQSWYTKDFPLFELLFPREQLPFPIKLSGIVLNGSEAKQTLKTIKKILKDKLISLVKECFALDVVVTLAALFGNLSHYLQNVNTARAIHREIEKDAGGSIHFGYFFSRMDMFRGIITFLQKIATQHGSINPKAQRMSINILVDLLTLTYQFDLVSSFEDGLHYFDEWHGVIIDNNKIIPINANGEPVAIYKDSDERKVLTLVEEIEETYQKDNWVETILEEFYNSIFRLDEEVEKVTKFPLSGLLNAYISAFQTFSHRFKDEVFIVPPTVFDSVMTKYLERQLSSEQIKKVLLYMQYSRDGQFPEHYQNRFFYTPFFLVPVGNYSLIVSHHSLIGSTRSTCFHDLTYGIHPFLTKHKNVDKAYALLKQELITAPFEKRVADIFQDKGWKVLLNAKGGINLKRKTVTVVPKEVGEIDIIAVDPDGKTVVVADCKYLFDYGATAKGLKTLKDRFVRGKKSYLRQVLRKKDWVATQIPSILKVLNFSNLSDDNVDVKAMLVLRSKPLFELETDVIILSSHDLVKWLDSFQQN